MVSRKFTGILGATGSVGQVFVSLLANHPDFEIKNLGASPRSTGKKYVEAVNWKQNELLPSIVEDMIVSECDPEAFKGCDVIFSGLDSEHAGPIEKAFVEAGFAVISNAKNYRKEKNVPLVVPISNSDHLEMVSKSLEDAKRAGKPKPGFIVCVSNCSTAGLVAPLKPLVDEFGPIEALTVTTLQAISGAGFSSGVLGIDMLDNVIPYISGEEEKIEWETRKILGRLNDDKSGIKLLTNDEMKISAQANRVAVSHGHVECISLRFKNRPAPSVDELKKCLRNYVCEATKLGCHSAPKQAIHVLTQLDRPQPRLDRNRDQGYCVSVGRIREDAVLDFKMVILSHNTIVGAAGAGLLIAELLLARNVL